MKYKKVMVLKVMCVIGLTAMVEGQLPFSTIANMTRVPSLPNPPNPLRNLPMPNMPDLPDLPDLPELPDLSKLPTPQNFLLHLLNVTAEELLDVAANFGFDEVLYEEVDFLHYLPNGTTTNYKMNSTRLDIDKDNPLKIVIHGWQSTGCSRNSAGQTKFWQKNEKTVSPFILI
ncbi:unnamed protein product [Callosobruchus maculatus]|uniref:Lipase domain-containing protein n=1 Tax=Callosobruchus maculatus TaxID=64391 RepID=A0A653BUD0_CALMS|nr:unnamed protein product [Callosobruchus maculatus]